MMGVTRACPACSWQQVNHSAQECDDLSWDNLSAFFLKVPTANKSAAAIPALPNLLLFTEAGNGSLHSTLNRAWPSPPIARTGQQWNASWNFVLFIWYSTPFPVRKTSMQLRCTCQWRATCTSASVFRILTTAPLFRYCDPYRPGSRESSLPRAHRQSKSDYQLPQLY